MTAKAHKFVPATADGPSSDLVNPLLTDMYQISMAYAYWKDKKHEQHAVFDLYFRTPPFKGEFTIFAGLEEVLRFVQTYSFSEPQISYLKTLMPLAEPGFWDWLSQVDCSGVRLYAIREGTIVFPRIPLIRVEGPLAVCQLLETTLLNLCNFPSLIATNAARFRRAAGPSATIIEMGLRRAQGPNGAMTATRYAYLGGCDATSNVLAGHLSGVAPKGTHAHALVCSYSKLSDLSSRELSGKDFVSVVERYKSELGYDRTNEGELAAFIAFAQAFPLNFLALVDTYDTLNSGVPNYICVALALRDFGFTPKGIRLDSGDLSYLSKETRRMFRDVDAKLGSDLAKGNIVASNDINEEVLLSLGEQGHEINTFGIGTHLVTCQAQPALGMVYKLVEIEGKPRIKLSQDTKKITLPGAKTAYRLIGNGGMPLLDLLVSTNEPKPVSGEKVLCRHPFDEKKRVYVTPSVVQPLLECVWMGAKSKPRPGDPENELRVNMRIVFPSLEEVKQYVNAQIKAMREDHMRALNPTPYKVSVTSHLYDFVHNLWINEVPIAELS